MQFEARNKGFAAMTGIVLKDAVWEADGASLWMKRAALFAAGVAALTISAKIQIASAPVPVTLQMLVIMSIGLGYGARLGAATVLGYLALGFAGQPVFAGPVAGPAYMLGSTGGYLIGFAVAAFVVGWLAERGWDRNPATTALALAVGLVPVYALGVAWLAWGFPVTAAASEFAGFGLAKGFEYGVFPFLWIDALKLVAAVIAFPAIWRLIGGRA